MRKCTQCGGRLRRIHRSFAERLRYMAMYECRECRAISSSPRRWALHLGPVTRCPLCGTYRVTRLKSPDKIDRWKKGLLNLAERFLGGGKLYHCRFCRVQFYDRRVLLSELPPEELETDSESETVPATNRPDTATSDE